MIFGDTVNDDYLVRNPNDFRYQPEPNILLDNLKFNLQTAIATGVQNIQTIIDNTVQNLKKNYENYEQNVCENNVMYGSADPILQLALSPPVEKLNYLYDNQDLSLQPDLKLVPNQTNLIHEELAEKEKRIRKLENKVNSLTKEVDELKKRKPLLKWLDRATEDSKKERII